jgi:SNF2 family DNA or RNA helicase
VASIADLRPGAVVRGLSLDGPVQVLAIEHHGSAVTLTWREANGQPVSRLLFLDDVELLEVGVDAQGWTFGANGELFLLAAEARRMQLGYLFDPMLAVRASAIEPLPHQIRAVYGAMLPRQPLRFLLADDPGAGKTIMAGLLIRELVLRGDLERCLIIAPGNLVEQWQDELANKFGLSFEIVTRDAIEASRVGNPFAEKPLLIARLDHLSRNDDLVARATVRSPERRRRRKRWKTLLLRHSAA